MQSISDYVVAILKSSDLETASHFFDKNSEAAVHVVRLATKHMVEFAEYDGVCETLEGPVRYSAGDAIVLGVAGEHWPVTRDVFFIKYESSGDQPSRTNGLYIRRKENLKAIKLLREVSLVANITRAQFNADAGDWLVKYGAKEYGVVKNSIFAKTYSVK